MKKVKFGFLIILIVNITGCSNHSDPKKELFVRAKISIEEYIRFNLEKEKSEIIVDSIIVVKIDSLSELESMKYKEIPILQDFEYQNKLLKNLTDQVTLSDGFLGKDITDIKKRDLNDQQEIVNNLLKHYDDLQNQKKHSDSTNLKYYLVSTKLYYQENMSAKTIERPLILNLGFKVVKFDDL